MRSTHTVGHEATSFDGAIDSNEQRVRSKPDNTAQLQSAIKTITTATSAKSFLPPDALLALLKDGQLLGRDADDKTDEDTKSTENDDLAWLLVSKSTTQVYGMILSLLLNQTIPLAEDILYWNQVLGSAEYTGLYTFQTAPLRIWAWSLDIYQETRNKLGRLRDNGHNTQLRDSQTISQRWHQFYGLVKETVQERSLADMQSRFMTPFTKCQMEAKSKMKRLRRLREMSASALGVLMDEGLMFDTHDESSVSSKGAASEDNDEWRTVVSKSVILMESVLRNVTASEMQPGEFEETVFASVEDGIEGEDCPERSLAHASNPPELALQLKNVIQKHVPDHIRAFDAAVGNYGRPSPLIRYWLPGLVLILSSSTLFRIAVNRKAEIAQWLEDLGKTSIDFWNNWVIDPVRKVIATIRHDKDSEIAIMSKESLRGDRASLERMVVDFACDNPDNSTGSRLTETEIADVRSKVREGDLTPVLKAYEKDLRRPFVGTLKGDLIRALLIQIQKTKVDVEVAVTGIDNLLKSQELVFGFIGLTPGILVLLGLSRWLGDHFAGRRNRHLGDKQGQTIRPLRNIDRILTAAVPSNQGMLSYKEHGLLLCEVHMLRQRVGKILPGEINDEFLEDVNELVDLRTGVDRQIKVVERLRWAYAKWLLI